MKRKINQSELQQTKKSRCTCDFIDENGNICNKSFASSNAMLTHKRIHGEKIFFCEICSKSFVQAANLATHMRSHGEKPCCQFQLADGTICGKVFNNLYLLDIHNRIHTDEKPFICDFIVDGSVCGKTFAQNSNLTTHKRVHSDEKPYSCNICQKRFRFVTNMKTHQNTHAKEKLFKCNFVKDAKCCGKVFKTSKNLNAHQEVHQVRNKIVCDVVIDGRKCGQEFLRLQTLEKHKKLMHIEPKTFVCNFKKDEIHCLEAFATKREMSKHRKLHNDGKAFICEVIVDEKCCGKEFTRNATLLKHKRDHNVECPKPFQCDFILSTGMCEYKSSRSDHLEAHKRVHSGERPFACKDENCDQRFTQQVHAKKHYQTWHSEVATLRHQTKEQRLANIFNKAGIRFERNCLIDYRCFLSGPGKSQTRAYLDFVVYKEDHVFIIECDEHQHDEVYNPWGYTVSCELSRMNNVQTAITLSSNGSVPKIVWIRYNPDKFYLDGQQRTVKVDRSNREKRLLHIIHTFKASLPVSVIYMYYDCKTVQGKKRPVILDSDDYNAEFSQCVLEPIVN